MTSTSSYPKIILSAQKSAKICQSRHPWIFSGAVTHMPDIKPGDPCLVTDEAGRILGSGWGQPKASIACRMIEYGSTPMPIDGDSIIRSIATALAERRLLIPSKTTNAFRLVNAEADGIPGLIVDIYDRIAVIQISTAGAEAYRDDIVNYLKQTIATEGVFEKSNAKSRKLEGLTPRSGWAWLPESPSDSPHEVMIHEHGIQYVVNVAGGQKTGFFLDQRDMRELVGQIATGRTLLNLCSYTGGFSLTALKSGASLVHSVDSSESAGDLLERNLHLNQLSGTEAHQFFKVDVSEFLSDNQCGLTHYDVIVLDPPGFVKKAADLRKGFNHYLDLNIKALNRLALGGVLLTFSCSPFMSEEDFVRMVKLAASKSGNRLKVLGYHRQALDHGVLLSHPEGRYLKGMIVKSC